MSSNKPSLQPPLQSSLEPSGTQDLPTVLSPAETMTILESLSGINRLIVELMYSSGLSASQCLRLRVQDIDFKRNIITVRKRKNSKHRETILSEEIRPRLIVQIDQSLDLQAKDNCNGVGPSLPSDLSEEYPNAFRSPSWMFIFPSTELYQQADSDKWCRHHLHTSVIRKAIKRAKTEARIDKQVRCSTFRHSFATHLLQDETDFHTVKKLLGHLDIKTIQLYSHIISQHEAANSNALDEANKPSEPYSNKLAHVC